MVNQLPMSKLGMSNQAYGLLLIFPLLLPATYLASPSGVTHTVRPSILRYTTRNLLTVPLTKVYCFLILPCMPPVGCLGFVFPVCSQFYHSALVLFLLWQSGALLFLSKGNLRRPALCFFFFFVWGSMWLHTVVFSCLANSERPRARGFNPALSFSRCKYKVKI